MDEPSLRALPPKTIIYNLEQLANFPKNSLPPAFNYAARHLRVWEYSSLNLPIWKSLDAQCKPRLVPIGYAPILTRIPKPKDQEIDVLFYGLPSDKRLAIYRELCLCGLRSVFVCGLYGAARDELIARSKLVLNLNLYAGNPIFEVARVSYLLANAKAVVSDIYPGSHVEPDLREAVEFVPAEQIVPACLRLIYDITGREALEKRGLEIILRRDIRAILADVLSSAPSEGS
jgi:hypothetical protein